MFIDRHRDQFGVEPICQALDVSASAYYHARERRASARRDEDERLLAAIREVHAANYESYGYRRSGRRSAGWGDRPALSGPAADASAGICGAKRRGRPWRTTIADPDAARRPDLVQRDFAAPAPDRLWVGDLTYLRCWEGGVYLAFVIDVYSRKVVGWQLASHMRTSLVLDALGMASAPSPGADFGLVAHTDQGSQYTAGSTPRPLTTTRSSHRSAASVTPMTTRWPSPSWTRSRPS